MKIVIMIVNIVAFGILFYLVTKEPPKGNEALLIYFFLLVPILNIGYLLWPGFERKRLEEEIKIKELKAKLSNKKGIKGG